MSRRTSVAIMLNKLSQQPAATRQNTRGATTYRHLLRDADVHTGVCGGGSRGFLRATHSGFHRADHHAEGSKTKAHRGLTAAVLACKAAEALQCRGDQEHRADHAAHGVAGQREDLARTRPHPHVRVAAIAMCCGGGQVSGQSGRWWWKRDETQITESVALVSIKRLDRQQRREWRVSHQAVALAAGPRHGGKRGRFARLHVQPAEMDRAALRKQALDQIGLA